MGMDENPYKSPAPNTPQAREAALPEAMTRKRSPCYLSTPEHIRSFVGRFIYIYTDKGEVELNDTGLRFVGKSGVPSEISLDTIASVSVGHFSRWAKPARLDFIAVRQKQGSMERTLLLTPTRSWATTTWATNKIVAEWVGFLQSVRRKPTSMNEVYKSSNGVLIVLLVVLVLGIASVCVCGLFGGVTWFLLQQQPPMPPQPMPLAAPDTLKEQPAEQPEPEQPERDQPEGEGGPSPAGAGRFLTKATSVL